MRQSSSGVIELYDRKGGFVDSRRYHNIAYRQAVLESWRKKYGRVFQTMHYHILPTINLKRGDYQGRKQQTLCLLADKVSLKAIASQLDVSVATVRNYLKTQRA